jgi:hypothetical protein
LETIVSSSSALTRIRRCQTIPARCDTIRHGLSLAAVIELAEANGYVLIATTIYNVLFIQRELYNAYFQELVPDNSIEALHEVTMGTSIYQLYDGTLEHLGDARNFYDIESPWMRKRCRCFHLKDGIFLLLHHQ